MDREATKQMYNQVLQQIQAGDPMAAYSIFEQMPFPDQMAMYVMPGVGDAIAAVEAGVYNQRSKDNFAQGNIGSGLMDAGIGGLALASTIPLLGKAAEVGNMGLKGARSGFNTLRSKMGDGMSGGGGGLTPKEQLDRLFQKKKDLIRNSNERGEFFPDEVYTIDAEIEKVMDIMDNPAGAVSRGGSKIDELNAEKKELIRDHEAMTERMPKDEARKYYPNDEIDAIDEQIYDLMSGSRGQSTSRIFRNDGGVSAAEKVDGEVGRLIDQGFEGDNFMYNQDFSVPVKMQARNRKTGEMIELETIPSQDGSIGVSITKLDNSGMQVETAATRDSSMMMKIQRELETENLTPQTRKRLEIQLNSLRRINR